MTQVLEGVREVAGKDESLLELVEAGEVKKPPLCTYNRWLAWRKSSKTRPSASTGEATVTTSRQEAELWRHVMLKLYGDDWRDALASQEEEAAIAAAAGEDEEEEEVDPHGSRAVLVSSPPAGNAGPTAVGGGAPAPGAGARVRDLLREGSEGSSG